MTLYKSIKLFYFANNIHFYLLIYIFIEIAIDKNPTLHNISKEFLFIYLIFLFIIIINCKFESYIDINCFICLYFLTEVYSFRLNKSSSNPST